MLTRFVLFGGPFVMNGVSNSVYAEVQTRTSMKDRQLGYKHMSIPDMFFVTIKEELVSQFWTDYHAAEKRYLEGFHEAWLGGI